MNRLVTLILLASGVDSKTNSKENIRAPRASVNENRHGGFWIGTFTKYEVTFHFFQTDPLPQFPPSFSQSHFVLIDKT